MMILKLIAVLLHYPDEELQGSALELLAAVRQDAHLDDGQRERLADFIGALAESDLMELQARYVETFDRGRSLSLHLFEHVHGESRDRGQAMVDLLSVYERHGFRVALSELPDYLPLFLEFLSTLPESEARQWLGEVSHILQLLHARLVEREQPYAVLFEPLLTLAGAELLPAEVERRVRGEERDDTPEALDKIWAEEPVTFGPGAAGCPAAQPRRPAQVTPIQWADRRGAGNKI